MPFFIFNSDYALDFVMREIEANVKQLFFVIEF